MTPVLLSGTDVTREGFGSGAVQLNEEEKEEMIEEKWEEENREEEEEGVNVKHTCCRGDLQSDLLFGSGQF